MPRILFVCIENAGRSQMAEAFAIKWAAPGVEIFSAGSRPTSAPHPAAIEAMREVGLDISQKKPKGFGELPQGVFDVVVGMGCGDACPISRAKRVVSWEIANPKDQPMDLVRRIRDEIEEKVKTLLNPGGGA